MTQLNYDTYKYIGFISYSSDPPAKLIRNLFEVKNDNLSFDFNYNFIQKL